MRLSILISALAGLTFFSSASASSSNAADTRQATRGMRVFAEVCAACHSAAGITHERLLALGISAHDIETATRASRRGNILFPEIYSSLAENYALNGGAIAGDLAELYSVRNDAKAYTYNILTGYIDAPAEFEKLQPADGRYFNSAFGNLYIAMLPPIVADGQVTYSDGTNSTVTQMAQDVAAFLQMTTHP